MTTHAPLAGLMVIDFSQGIAGPSCGGLFAEHGARVIKVEPPEGEWMRGLGTRIAGTSAQYLVYNRGKQSLALDVRKPAGREAALTLAGRADVVIQSARPGVFDRLGLGFEAIKARNPDVVYISVSGYGQSGPDRERPMVDTVGQAYSGLMSVTRSRDGVPVKIDATLIDAITGLYGFQAATMALWGGRKGKGARHLDISLLQSAAMIQGPNILEWGFVGRPPGLLNPPAGNYPTKDGWLAMTLVNQAQFEGICRALGRPDLITDGRFTTNAGRKENVAALRTIIDGETVKRTTAEWLPLFEKEHALAARINTYGDWLADPHVQQTAAAPMFEPGPGVTVPLPHLPGEAPFNAPAPKVGEHTRQILTEAGLDETAIRRLIEEGIAADGPPS